MNKDQLDILASLRESVNEDKVGLEADLERVKKQNRELAEKNRMQLEQVNVLLLEKVNLQSEGIGHRERMLQRERDFGYVVGRWFYFFPQLMSLVLVIFVRRLRARICQRISSSVCLPCMKRTLLSKSRIRLLKKS